MTANGQHDLKRGIDFIGVSVVFFCHDGQKRILLHKRSKHCRDEQGTWDSGGGAMEYGESVKDSVIREIQEEYGVTPQKIQFIEHADVHRQLADGTPTHWIALRFAALIDPKQARNNEPFKIDEMAWFSYDNIPLPLHSQMPSELATIHKLGII